MPKKSILLVEDDPGIAKSLANSLRFQGYDLRVEGSLKEARQALEKEFDLILLDVNLPDGSGFDLCEEIRADGRTMPILILTARAEEAAAVKGLSLGADDYLRKPVGTDELSARIKKYLREKKGRLKLGDLVLDLDQRAVAYGEQSLTLTPREFELLALIMEKSGELVTREALLRSFDREGELLDRTLDSHLSHLRSKLKKACGDRVAITAVYGVGFRMEVK